MIIQFKTMESTMKNIFTAVVTTAIFAAMSTAAFAADAPSAADTKAIKKACHAQFKTDKAGYKTCLTDHNVVAKDSKD